MALLLTLVNRNATARRQRDQAVFGISRADDWTALGRAMRTGEPPADTTFDGPLLVMVQRRREQLRRSVFFLILMVLGVTMALIGAALDPVPSVIFRQCFSDVLFIPFAAYVVRSSRRLARLEKRLRSRAPQAA
jgi:hypothetical protein